MSEKVEVLWLGQQDVISAGGLDMAAAMKDVEDVFRLHATGGYVLPEKIVLEWEERPPDGKESHVNIMPGYLGGAVQCSGAQDDRQFSPQPL